MDKPWGYRVNISIYVEGDYPDSDAVILGANVAAGVLEDSGSKIDFAGAKVSAVYDRPYDQGAS